MGGSSTGTGVGTRTSNGKGAGAIDLVLLLRSERSGHTSQLELGREGQSGILRLGGILETKRLVSDKVLVGIRSDGGVRHKLERAGVGNVGGGRDQLERGLLLSVSNVNGDLAGTEVLQGRSRSVGVLNPLDGLVLTGLPRGGGGGRSGVNSRESRGQDGSQGQKEGDGMHYGDEEGECE